MKFGIFDHIEMADRSMAAAFQERIRFVQAADEAGFWGYHVAEHHASPLNTVPVPGVWLGAVAQATKRIHMGPLTYLLPLYSPLRLADEICILDHLSNGRYEVGVGRGVSPFELGYHKIDHSKSREIFEDAFKCLKVALTSVTFSYESERYAYKDVPMPLRPLQGPHPAFWYASSNATGSAFAGEEGLHFTTNGPTARARANIDVYREALAKRGGAAQAKGEFKGGAAIGVLRQIVVADTDEQAIAIAAPAVAHHHANLTHLARKHAHEGGVAQRLNIPLAATIEDALREGTVIAGAPDTVRAQIERQVEELGINYLLTYPFFGDMRFDQAMRSLNLFASEVMPGLAHL
jgi:alkanesulfonate monooxygenase SsuD/methylene tetrahydromethanopterin reductase-like flavin-dependent oxidoreductase (luciferase family)